MYTMSSIKLSIFLSAMYLAPSEEISSKERRMIWEVVSGNNSWWLKYYYQEALGIDLAEVEYSGDISFCLNFLVFLNDLQRWQKSLIGKHPLASRKFPGFDNNSLSDEEAIHRDIFNYFLKFKPERFIGLGMDECPKAPCGDILHKYKRAFDIYVENGDHFSRYRPSNEKIFEILQAMYT